MLEILPWFQSDCWSNRAGFFFRGLNFEGNANDVPSAAENDFANRLQNKYLGIRDLRRHGL